MTPEPNAAPVVPPAEKPSLKVRMKALFDEFGMVAVGTYLVIFALVIAGFAIAIRMGIEVDGAAGTAGTLAAAWVAAKVTQPLRILATLVLTPFIGRFLRRFKKPTAV